MGNLKDKSKKEVKKYDIFGKSNFKMRSSGYLYMHWCML